MEKIDNNETARWEFFNRSYAQSALGWVDEVYHPREVVDTQLQVDQLFPILFQFHYFEEESAPLNHDTATIGTFHYLEGTHARIMTLAKNYSIKLRVQNSQNAYGSYQVMINNLVSYTFSLNAKEEKELTFEVFLSQHQLELTFKAIEAATEELLVHSLSLEEKKQEKADKPTIYIASDSTAQTYEPKDFPQAGWGEFLYFYLFEGHNATIIRDKTSSYPQAYNYSSENLTIVNRSIGGRSSRSFIEEGKFAQLLAFLKEDDYLLIQWGDNDATTFRPMRYVASQDFSKYLEQYILSALDRKVHPVLITPPPRYHFVHPFEAVISFDDYRQVTLAMAERYQIPVIDLGKMGAEFLSLLGEKKAKCLFMQLPKHQYKNFEDGLTDATYFNQLGAKMMAKFIAKKFTEEFPEIQFQSEHFPVLLDKPTNLTATILENKIFVRWSAVSNALYYSVKVIQEENIKTIITLQPFFNDIAVKNHYHVCYEVSAHTFKCGSPVEQFTLVHEFMNKKQTKEKITGVNLYEKDTDTFPDKFAFSLRFNHYTGINNYQIILKDIINEQESILEELPATRVTDLHSYQIKKGNQYAIKVRGYNEKQHQEIFSDLIPITS